MRATIMPWFAVALLSGAGCADAKHEAFTAAVSPERNVSATPPPAAGMDSMAFTKADAAAAPGAADKALKEGQQRKIIFTADVAVTVEDFAKAEREVAALVASYGGYLAESNVTGSPGEHRSGHWKARIPVDRFDSFVDGVAALGDLRERRTSSSDVSEEFYDLEARIKNKAAEEVRLIRHLEVSTGKLEEILQVERELSRVREEVERMQGRKQVLANLTALTTVTIAVQERFGYVPTESPTFASRMANSFRGSLDALISVGQSVALAAAAIAPWLPVIAVAAALLLLARHRRLAGRAARRSGAA